MPFQLLTFAIAAWGAGLATWTAVAGHRRETRREEREARRDQRSVKVTASGTPAREHTVVHVVNTGTRPVVIEGVGLTLEDGTRVTPSLLTGGEEDEELGDELPRPLTDGEALRQVFDLRSIINYESVPIAVWAEDTEGRVYEGVAPEGLRENVRQTTAWYRDHPEDLYRED